MPLASLPHLVLLRPYPFAWGGGACELRRTPPPFTCSAVRASGMPQAFTPSSRALPRVSATALAFARSLRAPFVSARPPAVERRGRRPDAHEGRQTRAGGQWTCAGGLRTRPRRGAAVGDADGGAAQMSSRRGAAVAGPGGGRGEWIG